ncbi:cyanophycinase [Rheinheimera sp. MMS21-TC3]|uniref:cyanophycinase n=1 Tax=Rheinheimera sp. MMS21-TC3 TaxID=3072790 RepID=UPI0028C3FE05|nr:cyanophycinase [Rheinheimera sp. MMS21-TC3]WNO61531.1 cyanophycinase [Rheinheimera sp. MMS21-TC3]
MKLLSLYLTSILMTCSVAANSTSTTANNAADYNMVLIGGGLKVCSSTDTKFCTSKDVFSAAAKSSAKFNLTAENIKNIADPTFWGEQRIIEQQQVLALLQHLANRLDNEQVTERELLRLLRGADLEVDGVWISGRVVYNALTDREVNYIFDQLQIMVRSESNRRNSLRQKVYADLKQTKDIFSIEILQKIVELAQQVAGPQRKPRILVVTAGARDPFSDVDFYTNLFNEAGMTASWLPLTAAYQMAQQQAESGKASCENLSELIAEFHGSYQRQRIYPDLMAELESFCQAGGEAAVNQLKRADAIFIADGDASRIVQAFRLQDGSASVELQQLDRMLKAGQIILAANDSAATAISGRSYQGMKTPMLTSGDSYSAMQYGAFDLPAPQAGCDKDQSCLNGLAEHHLTFSSQGGLGLFPWGVVDSQLSEQGRQGRLIRLLHDTQSPFGFGIDETTALLVKFKTTTENEQVVEFKVLGENGVFLVDNQSSEGSGEGSKLTIKKVSTHYLTRDDSAELKQGLLRTQFSDWKFAANTIQTPMLVSGDIFERDNYRQLAQLLCLTQSRQADGKAVRVGQGHAITLYKDHSSHTRQGVYRQSGVEVQYCSYRNILVDIQPL